MELVCPRRYFKTNDQNINEAYIKIKNEIFFYEVLVILDYILTLLHCSVVTIFRIFPEFFWFRVFTNPPFRKFQWRSLRQDPPPRASLYRYIRNT